MISVAGTGTLIARFTQRHRARVAAEILTIAIAASVAVVLRVVLVKKKGTIMTADLTCSECSEDFETGFPFGSDVKCPECGVWLQTEMDEDWDNLWAWVVGKADDQGRP